MDRGADLGFAYGFCHVLTAAVSDLAPAGEPLGLFCQGECVHSVFRVPHTSPPVFLDAFGPEQGTDALAAKASRYTRPGERYEWRRMDAAAIGRLAPAVGRLFASRARREAGRLLHEADLLVGKAEGEGIDAAAIASPSFAPCP